MRDWQVCWDQVGYWLIYLIITFRGFRSRDSLYWWGLLECGSRDVMKGIEQHIYGGW